MLPVIAIVGRPNVGKSTLFNQLTKSREAFDAIFEKEEIRHHTFLVRNYLTHIPHTKISFFPI